MKPISVTEQILFAPVWRKKIEGNYLAIPDTGCWEWTASIDRHGYGLVQAQIGGRFLRTGAHRAVWVVHRGPILNDLTLDHLCCNPKCVNPNHLEPVTHTENMRRIRLRRTGPYKRRTLKDPSEMTCGKHGRADGAVTVDPVGLRWRCKICHREYQRRYYLKKKASKAKG